MPAFRHGQLFVMEGMGWTKQAEIDLKLTRFPNGPAIVQAVASGKMDVMCFGIGAANIHAAAERWRAKLSDRQWRDIRYEDFVRDPVAGLKRLCDFLGEDYAEEMLAFHATPMARREWPGANGPARTKGPLQRQARRRPRQGGAVGLRLT